MSVEYDLSESLSIFRQYGLTKKSSDLNQLDVRFNKPKLKAEINVSAASRTSEGVLFNVRIEYQIKLFASFNKEMIDCGFIEKEGLKLVPMRDYITGLFKPDENGSFPLYEKGKKEVETPFAVMYFSNYNDLRALKMCKKNMHPDNYPAVVKKFGQFINENYDVIKITNFFSKNSRLTIAEKYLIWGELEPSKLFAFADKTKLLNDPYITELLKNSNYTFPYHQEIVELERLYDGLTKRGEFPTTNTVAVKFLTENIQYFEKLYQSIGDDSNYSNKENAVRQIRDTINGNKAYSIRKNLKACTKDGEVIIHF